MTKFLTAAALIIAVSVGSIATTTPADAGPGGYSLNGGLNTGPFEAVNGR